MFILIPAMDREYRTENERKINLDLCPGVNESRRYQNTQFNLSVHVSITQN